MERLTKKDCYGHWYTSERVYDRFPVSEPYPHAFDGKAIDRLAHYEDLEEQGRLVVLQAKDRDTVFVIGDRQAVECFIVETYLDYENVPEHLVSFSCENDCEGCPFNNWHQDYSGEYSCDGEWGQGVIKESDIGKTIFLTREEAEAALQGKEVT